MIRALLEAIALALFCFGVLTWCAIAGALING